MLTETPCYRTAHQRVRNARGKAGEHAAPAPGVVKIRLQGDTFASDVLVTILREHPAVEILTGPD